MTGTAWDAAAIERVTVRRNDEPLQVADGTTHWTTQLTLAPGTNVIRIQAVDAAGNVSREIRRSYFHIVKSRLAVRVEGAGKLVPNLDGAELEVGRTYVLRALPDAGQLLMSWQGTSSQLPVLRFTMTSNLVIVATFGPNPFLPVKGAYAGLVANTNGVLPEHSGYFRLNTTASGRCTGKLLLAGARFGFSGRFDLEGRSTILICRRDSNPLQLALALDLAGAAPEISGILTDGLWVSSLAGNRNPYHPRRNPVPQSGRRDFVLEEGDSTAGTGAGRIYRGGTTLVKGRLKDARPFATRSHVSRQGDYPFYLSLNRGREVVIGWLNFPIESASDAGGSVLWVGTGTDAFATTLHAQTAPPFPG